MRNDTEEGWLRGVKDWEENLKKGIYEEPDNPFCQKPSSEFATHEEWEIEWAKNRAWFDGYRESKRAYFNNKYNILELQEKIRKLIESYGLVVKFEDEYNWAYMETPEGFEANLIEYNGKG